MACDGCRCKVEKWCIQNKLIMKTTLIFIFFLCQIFSGCSSENMELEIVEMKYELDLITAGFEFEESRSKISYKKATSTRYKVFKNELSVENLNLLEKRLILNGYTIKKYSYDIIIACSNIENKIYKKYLLGSYKSNWSIMANASTYDNCK
jgi:hypothetical protein